jgi:hypothetical protein
LPVDPIQPNSVWTDGTKRSLTILERHGDKFRASFISGAGNVREIFGSVKDGRISWLAKDVHAADASIGSGDDFVGIIGGDKIAFASSHHSFTLFRSVATPVAASAAVTVYKPEDSKLRILKEQAPNIQAWVTSPLYQWVPEDIYQNMAHLQQDLLDEKEDRVKQTPALADAYAFASGLCAQFKLAIEARKAAVVASGGPNPPLRSQLTNWRRDNLTWPMWAEERDERHERQAWVKKHQDQMNQWAGVAANWTTKLNLFYVNFRQHYRESLHGN